MDGDSQYVLRCGRCKKPFDKESSLKRHSYYCRSRTAGKTTRARSCVSCANRKARCDNRRPGCSTCIAKGIECRYPANTGTRPAAQRSDDAGVENHPQSGNARDISLDNTLILSDPVFTDFGAKYLDWNDPNFDFVDFLDPRPSEATIIPSDTGLLSSYPTPFTAQLQQTVFSPDSSLAMSPTRSLIQRPKLKTGSARTANLILHTLKSYPRMMLRPSTFPPFIHPSSVSSSFAETEIEPLCNCIALVHMLTSGVPGTRKLFWKNVRQECERFCAEHANMNKWELLSAMQALSIYTITRVEEGETEHNNFDFLLLAAVTVISKQLACSDTTQNSDDGIGWKDWIFEESKRRLCVIYQVVNMLVYFEPISLCNLDNGLILGPLPAKKQLWQAHDEVAWKKEAEMEPGVWTALGLAASGDLVTLDQDKVHSTVDWGEWCSGMDGLGGLVMLAASLV